MSSTRPLAALPRILSALAGRQRVRVLGAELGCRGWLLANAAVRGQREHAGVPASSENANGGPIVVLVADEAQARMVAADIAFFSGLSWRGNGFELDGPIVVVPEIESSPYADSSPDPRGLGARLAAMHRLLDADVLPRVVIASVQALSRKVMPKSAFVELCHTWNAGEAWPREQVEHALGSAGYQRVEIVEDPGTYAVRGGVVDVFVPRMRFPVRIEWFGDEIESMRLFDPQTQRSLKSLDSCAVHPVRETLKTTQADMRARILELGDEVNAPSSRSRQVLDNLEHGLDFFGIDALTPLFHDALVPLWTYLPATASWYVDEPEAIASLIARNREDIDASYQRAFASHALACSPRHFYVDDAELERVIVDAHVVATRIDARSEQFDQGREVVRIELDRSLKLRAELEAARKRKGSEVLKPVIDALRERVADERVWRVVLVAPNLTHAERLTSLLRGYGLPLAAPREAEGEQLELHAHEPGKTVVQVVAGSLSEGFGSREERFLILSEADIFGRISRRAQPQRRATGLGHLTQLSVGDYVVHVQHGVGRYLGLSKLTLRGVPADFVLIEYAGTDKLYLPVYRLHEIERFVAADARPPKLDRLGGATFLVKTSRVKQEIRQMADELLQIYAQRAALTGHAYPEPDDLYEQFEATFPFEETPDQQQAISVVSDDLSRPQPMDRLICGDVGFGKTEVALRATFRVATSGKQVAVLAPTTILVQQHFNTFRERMAAFGVEVAVLNRFLDAKGKQKVLEGLREGTIDVVVGTHRVLSRDVRFKDLGLLVIDEEQRFGVAQKERFKKLKTQIDVLAMSATPIPRTLQMSLLGIREISLVMTPPADRLAVRTIIMRPGDAALEDALRRELARGGQVFYVVPRIEGIENHALRIRELVPEARVLVAHGQMPAELLEKTMLQFVEHRADVLISTTIIESGLDIPRANTMFIARADQFGMSQLYQLRGRIGRSKVRAFCYLLVDSLERLSPEARHRLEAMQRYSELGSGFHVASRDLEIRGAGELLGARQSGHIQAIGFEAYSRILGEAVSELRGEPILRESDPEIVFDIAAFLPDDYVEDIGQRLDLYRRLAVAQDADEVAEVMSEIEDRFGELPSEAQALGWIMTCKTYGRRLRASALELAGTRFSIRLGPETPLAAEVVAKLVAQPDLGLRLLGPDRIAMRVAEDGTTSVPARLQACVRELSRLVSHTPAR